MKKRSSITFSLLLVVGDVAAILAAYVLAYIVRVKLSHTPIVNFVAAQDYFTSLLILLPFIIIWFSLIGTYSSRAQHPLGQIGRLLVGAFGAMLFMIFIDFFDAKTLFPAKLVPVYGFVLSIILLGLVRGGLYLARWLMRRKNRRQQTVLVVGDNDVARDLVADIERPASGLMIHSVIGDRRKKFVTHGDFAAAVRNVSPDIIIQVSTDAAPAIDQTLLDFAQNNFVEFKFVPRELSNHIDMELFLRDTPVMAISQTRLSGWGRVAKRGFDVAASSAALIITSPFMLVIWLILMTTGGAPIYKRTRLTRYGTSFTIYKFRSLKRAFNGLDPEAGFAKMGRPELAKKYRANGDFLDDDPRISRFGKFIRKTSLDELPQLFNVWRGDISIVGPRALIAEELNQSEYRNLILSVRSGLTGLAVVSGRRDLSFEQRRKLDVYYVQHWSFGLDLQIIFKTIWQILSGRGAK